MQTELMTTLSPNNRGLISVWPALLMETKTPHGHGRHICVSVCVCACLPLSCRIRIIKTLFSAHIKCN